MSLHRSLKTQPAALNQHRNVLTRPERIARLQEEGRFDPEKDTPMYLLKVASRKIVVAKKKKKDEDDSDTADEAGDDKN